MFYLVIFLVLLMLWDIYDMTLKKQIKTVIKISLSTIIFAIVNLLVLMSSLKVDYSETLYLLNFKENNIVLFILWILFNLGYFYYIFKIIKRKERKKMQKRIITLGFYMIVLLLISGYLLIILHNIMPYILLILLIGGLVLIVKNYVKTRNNYLLIPVVLLSFLTYYNFFTYKGALRLNVTLNGYIIEAYQTEYKELIHIKDEKAKNFYPLKNIPVESGTMGIISVYNYMGIKIAKYRGF